MRHTIAVLVENKFGVLSRVSGLFSGRGFNIDSLSVGETIDPAVSLMTIVTTGDDQIVEQITKQLNKLIDVIKVVDYMEIDHVERELVLIKCTPKKNDKAEFLKLAEIFRINNVKSITLVHIEVPCCFVLTRLVEEALKRSGKNTVIKDYTVSIKGDII